MLTRVRQLLVLTWKPALIGAITLFAAVFLLFAHLGTNPAQLSPNEVSSLSTAQRLGSIASNPVNSPFYLPEHYLMRLSAHSITMDRLLPAVYGLITLILFFGILKFWDDATTALIGVVLMGTSAWFLNTVRLATPDVLMLAILALLACGLWLKHTFKRNLVMLFCGVAAALSLYIPGFIWFVIGGVIWQRRTVLHELKRTRLWGRIIALSGFIVLAAPFILASSRHVTTLLFGLGLPLKWPDTPQLLKNLIHIPESIFYKTQPNPTRWLGTLPLLDVFEDAMFLLGIYVLWSYRELSRTRILTAIAIVSIVLITLGGEVSYSILIPLVYVTITAGILYLWQAWASVFPRNPVAKGVGIALITLAIILSCNYQLRRYFVAWTSSPTTKAVFNRPAEIFDTISR